MFTISSITFVWNFILKFSSTIQTFINFLHNIKIRVAYQTRTDHLTLEGSYVTTTLMRQICIESGKRRCRSPYDWLRTHSFQDWIRSRSNSLSRCREQWNRTTYPIKSTNCLAGSRYHRLALLSKINSYLKKTKRGLC